MIAKGFEYYYYSDYYRINLYTNDHKNNERKIESIFIILREE
jgi:hypothetical protein